ncbi:unnamed protein product [Microthlaspi erraticum]|uniref:Reverse transcriptase zinc-binding domain-containing protein n=1 Tax=Microthlaspi erraticum TaxID=1685480 RepID=A0A6D2KUG3_9BRAS|nr:unnamed protein product [Microthlaspi erraticum]
MTICNTYIAKAQLPQYPPPFQFPFPLPFQPNLGMPRFPFPFPLPFQQSPGMPRFPFPLPFQPSPGMPGNFGMSKCWSTLMDMPGCFARSDNLFQDRNGEKVFFWFDDWLKQGRLLDILGDSGTRVIGISRTVKVSEVVLNGTWRVRRRQGQVTQQVLVQIQTHPVPHPDAGGDIVLWRHKSDNYPDRFSAASTWEQIRKSRGRVPWCKVVWFPQGVPRFSFITWVCVRDRLATGVRMRSWGIEQACLFCGEWEES